MEVSAISRGRFQPLRRDTGKHLRINEYIKRSPIRLIDENDEQVGVVTTDEAKRRAREVGLDLVEVSPNSDPPVCRIMDYGKWKYQQRKKEQKAKSHSKQSELKEVRVRPKIDKHDLDIKLAKAREFLEENNKVQFTMLFKGRETMHRDLGIKALEEVAAGLADLSKVETAPKLLGKRMTMVLAPERKSAEKKGKDQAADAAPAAAAPEAPRPAPGSPTSPEALRPAAGVPPRTTPTAPQGAPAARPSGPGPLGPRPAPARPAEGGPAPAPRPAGPRVVAPSAIRPAGAGASQVTPRKPPTGTPPTGSPGTGASPAGAATTGASSTGPAARS